ncbi:SemiSWEET transporter [Mucilaginibacter defluvii]|uniref:MtN3 and saliva related transmembrane protein n=1 Tax=Mucilaginibacter defluvii TaxID=1196019 RepID=A0ABP9FJ19_9SPHI
MDSLEILGLIAGICTSTASIPQIVTTIKKKKVADVSPFMFLVLLAGNVLWTWYGFQRSDLPIIATNLFSVLMDIVMLFLRFKYRNERVEH